MDIMVAEVVEVDARRAACPKRRPTAASIQRRIRARCPQNDEVGGESEGVLGACLSGSR